VSGYWLLCFVKAGFTVFFLEGQYLALPLENAINTVMLVFDISGLIVGYIATRNLIKSESTRFYMNQLWGTEEEPEGSPAPGVGVSGLPPKEHL